MHDPMAADAVEAMGLHVHLTDGELVARCRTGEPEAWNELVERFSRYVYAICVQAFKLSEHDAEDVFQEVFTRAYEHLDKLRDDNAIRPWLAHLTRRAHIRRPAPKPPDHNPIRPWLAQLTRRLCIDRLRTGAHEQPEDVIDPMGADETLARLDDAIAVHEGLAILPASCQGRLG